METSDATYHHWRAQYGGVRSMDVVHEHLECAEVRNSKDHRVIQEVVSKELHEEDRGGRIDDGPVGLGAQPRVSTVR